MTWSAVTVAALVVGAVVTWPGRQPRPTMAGLPRRPSPSEPVEDLSVDDVAATMVLLGLALGTGAGVIESLETVARHGPAAASRDLRTVAPALRWGVDWSVAWASVGPVWARTGTALGLSVRAGLSPAQLLRDGAADLRADQAQRLELAAARIGVRMVVPVGVTFLPAFVLTTVVPVVVALAGQVTGS